MKVRGIKTSGLTESHHGHWKSLMDGPWGVTFGAGGSRGVEKRSLKSWPVHTRTLSLVQTSRGYSYIKQVWLTALINLSIHPGGPFSHPLLDLYHIQGRCDLAGVVTQDQRGPSRSPWEKWIFKCYIYQAVFNTRTERTNWFRMKEHVIFSLGSDWGRNQIQKHNSQQINKYIYE